MSDRNRVLGFKPIDEPLLGEYRRDLKVAQLARAQAQHEAKKRQAAQAGDGGVGIRQ